MYLKGKIVYKKIRLAFCEYILIFLLFKKKIYSMQM